MYTISMLCTHIHIHMHSSSTSTAHPHSCLLKEVIAKESSLVSCLLSKDDQNLNNLLFLFNLFKCALQTFYSLKAHCFWLGIAHYFLATRVQRLPGAVGSNPGPSDFQPDAMTTALSTSVISLHFLPPSLLLHFPAQLYAFPELPIHPYLNCSTPNLQFLPRSRQLNNFVNLNFRLSHLTTFRFQIFS